MLNVASAGNCGILLWDIHSKNSDQSIPDKSAFLGPERFYGTDQYTEDKST